MLSEVKRKVFAKAPARGLSTHSWDMSSISYFALRFSPNV